MLSVRCSSLLLFCILYFSLLSFVLFIRVYSCLFVAKISLLSVQSASKSLFPSFSSVLFIRDYSCSFVAKIFFSC